MQGEFSKYPAPGLHCEGIVDIPELDTSVF